MYHLGQQNVDLHIHSPIRLYGSVLSWLSTEATLPIIFESKNDAVVGDWRQLPIEELHNFYSSPN
jgi:hypothetical protein